MDDNLVKVTRLRALRAVNGISAKELSRRIGIGKSTILNYEKTGKIPKGAQYIICEHFNIPNNIDLGQIVQIDKVYFDKRSHTFD